MMMAVEAFNPETEALKIVQLDDNVSDLLSSRTSCASARRRLSALVKSKFSEA